MGNFSRDTFDKLKHYVGVRLQQGVPLVDADWNEQEDIRRYELQAFLKWFVGNGVPEGNDGFRIISIVNKIILTSKKNDDGVSSVEVNWKKSTAAKILGFGPSNYLASRAAPPAAQLTGEVTGDFEFEEEGLTLVVSADGMEEETVTFKKGNFTAAEVVAAINSAMSNLTASAGTGNDFDIKGGDGTAEGAGRCLVEGWDAINESDLKYTAQPLFDNKELAEEWGVDPVKQLTTPTTDRTDTFYLDVWEREVGAAEDNDLVNSEIGVETCVRHKLEWCVRVDEGSKRYDKEEYHHYYDLAEIKWEDGKIKEVKDLRTIKLTLTSVKDELEKVKRTSASKTELEYVRQATVNRWINGGEIEYKRNEGKYESNIDKMFCIISGQEITFGKAKGGGKIKEDENCVVLARANGLKEEIEFIVTRRNLLEWLNSWTFGKWMPAKDTEPVLKSAFSLPLYFFETVGAKEFKKTDLRPQGVLDTWLAELAGRLDAPERRMCIVPLLQQTIFGRAVPVATVSVGRLPYGVAFDGAHIWVVTQADNSVSKIDIATNKVVATVSVGKSPHGVAFDGAHIWVANYGDKTVNKIDILTNKVVATVSVGKSPHGVAFDGAHIWVTTLADNSVSKIDIATNKVVATVSVGDGPYGVAFDGLHIWVSNARGNSVSKIDIATNKVVATVSVGKSPFGVAFDGAHIWVANYGYKTVNKIDILTNKVVATVSVGESPHDVAFDGAHIWVANTRGNSVSKIDIATNKVVATVSVGESPHDVAFDGAHIWVGNYKDASVSKILRGDLK
jgi:YVTN family beta-propeller protein